MSDRIFRTELLIPSGGALLAARVHRNVDNLIERQSALIATGSWLTVKEQMADLYAGRLAGLGFTVLTFDFAGWGESTGEGRHIEIPARKIADILAVSRHLALQSWVRDGEVGYLGICASAMYAAAAIRAGAPISSFASIAGWYHDTASVSGFYGGAEGVFQRMARSGAALRQWKSTGKDMLVPAYDEGNEREQTWTHWLGFNGLSQAEHLEVPTLFVHGDECALPDNVRRIHERMPGSKEMIWHPGFQVDYYDRPDLVALSVEAASAHFRRTLSKTR
jgi:hypothetical protein